MYVLKLFCSEFCGDIRNKGSEMVMSKAHCLPSLPYSTSNNNPPHTHPPQYSKHLTTGIKTVQNRHKPPVPEKGGDLLL